MNHSQRHRGPNPKDIGLFSDRHVPALREALKDYCWLLSKGYTAKSSLKLVGDRFSLVERQRLLLMRIGCTESQAKNRFQKSIPANQLADREIFVDGFNVLITIEAALSAGFIFVGHDGCLRDMSSIHGTYRRVQETHAAIELVGQTFHKLGTGTVHWLLDKPVSNSGRLKTILREIAEPNGWDWNIELHPSPDYELKTMNQLTVTTDAVILDSVDEWFNLNKYVVENSIPNAKCIDLN
ncbi:MAG: DUF434 domain-containing protein [Mariniblastus sp.]